jgi:type III restriction enzyme
MKVTLKTFQEQAVDEMLRVFRAARQVRGDAPQAVVLSAPTGAGKTIIATAFIETLLHGNQEQPGDPEFTFLWLTDQPELNQQTKEKMALAASALTADDLIILDAAFDAERLPAGRVCFLNTQKLATGTTFTRSSDHRTWSFWETITNTLRAAPDHFVLVIDEAHRGMRGRDAKAADSIVQKFLMGSAGEIPPIPLVIGISATPQRFLRFLEDTRRVRWQVEVSPQHVRESGLIKETVCVFYPEDTRTAPATVLVEAAKAWRAYADAWARYAEVNPGEPVVHPVLLVQVEDGTRSRISHTDLNQVVETLGREMKPEPNSGWIAHAFQEQEGELTYAGHRVRRLAPSQIDADPEVWAVLFKTSLNTGWDCPRAETMVSFRAAHDETNIAQLVGRMVRAPLARRISGDELLNSVRLYLPYYDRTTVQRVVQHLADDPAAVPPVKVREGKDLVRLHRAPGSELCFTLLESLPTYTIPRGRRWTPVVRLAKLAQILAHTGLEDNPVREYRAAAVQVLERERERLAAEGGLQRRFEEAEAVKLAQIRVQYAAGNPEGEEAAGARLTLAEADVNQLFYEAGRLLGEGLQNEYLRARKHGWDPAHGEFSARLARIEAYVLASDGLTLAALHTMCDDMAAKWLDTHKPQFSGLPERYRLQLREIEGATDQPTLTVPEVPDFMEWESCEQAWDRHIFVGDDGTFREDFAGSGWEKTVIAEELRDPTVVGWLRMLDRKDWAICVPYRRAGEIAGAYPDFLIFRQTPGGVIADIVDPHRLADEYAPARAAGLAEFAERHADRFGRIELVIVDDGRIKRLDLVKAAVRRQVAAVSSHAHLKQLFDEA